MSATPLCRVTRTRFFRPLRRLIGTTSLRRVVIDHRQAIALAPVAERAGTPPVAGAPVGRSIFILRSSHPVDVGWNSLTSLPATGGERAGKCCTTEPLKIFEPKPTRMVQSPFANEKPLFVLRFSATEE
jgi:hypothetical protein